MGTRSSIGYLLPNGSVKAVYCHWDGYPEYNGEILMKNYTELSKVEELISLGAISSLGKTTKYTEKDYDETNECTRDYHRWRNEEISIQTYKDIGDYKEHGFDACQEYIYLFADGNWYVMGCYNEGWKLVSDYLNEAYAC